MTREQAEQAIAAHERAAARTKTAAKRLQHLKAIEHYREEFNIKPAVSFGRDETMYHRQHMQRLEADKISHYRQTGKVIP